MDKNEYARTQLGIITAAKAVATLDLPAFIATINTTEAVAPIIDPTLYQKAFANLSAVKKLAEALLPVKKAYDELFATVLDTAVKGDMSLPKD